MTWPHLVNFFYQKLRKVCPIRYPKTRRRVAPPFFFAICEKPQGGCTNPPMSGRRLNSGVNGFVSWQAICCFFNRSSNSLRSRTRGGSYPPPPLLCREWWRNGECQRGLKRHFKVLKNCLGNTFYPRLTGGGEFKAPSWIFASATAKKEQRYRRETWQTFSYNNLTSSVNFVLNPSDFFGDMVDFVTSLTTRHFWSKIVQTSRVCGRRSF